MKLFVSYSHQDNVFVNKLTADLEQQGFEVWLDRGNIQGGDAWRKAIIQGINDCDAFLVILSTMSTTSRNVTKEVSIADEREKHIFPILAEPCKIPEDLEYQLTGVQYTDLSGNNYVEGFNRLIASLQGTPASSVKPPVTNPEPNLPNNSQPNNLQPNNPQQNNLQQPMLSEADFLKQLIGTWNVTVQHPYTGMIGQGQTTFYGTGQFQTVLDTPGGQIQAQGQWAMIGHQLGMQGMHFLTLMPYNVLPYALAIQVTGAGVGVFQGITTAGEQVYLQKVG